MGYNGSAKKMSKKNKLLLTILICSIAVVFSLLAVLLYINYYARVQVVLTTISRYKDGEIKSVSEYDIINIKKGRNVSYLPTPYVEGYQFKGWYMDEDCTNPFDFNLALEQHMQVYGKLDLLEYSIELVLDEKIKVKRNITQSFSYSGGFTIEDIIRLPYADDQISLSDGSQISVGEYKTLYKEGYTFEGWGFSSSTYTPVNTNFRMTADNLTFYAIWKPIAVELQFMTMDLSFAETQVQTNIINERYDRVTGGISYDGNYEVYISESLEYGDRVSDIASPYDEYKNFDFAGWYMDPLFTVPVKFAQLYIRNGYFTLTKEDNTDILEDMLYFYPAQLPTEEQKQLIYQYSDKSENNSYIQLFAKWTPKRYTIEFNLNLPSAGSYVDTTNMRAIMNPEAPLHIYNDDGSYIKLKTDVYQGCNLRSTRTESGVLYLESYFEDVVFVDNDATGLPLYTLFGWSSDPSGAGYDALNTSDLYFDKSHFAIKGNVITIYAQWVSYYRVNYYFSNGTVGSQVLLDTVNVKSNRIDLADFYDLVVDVNNDNRQITFTEKQKRINGLTKNYFVPNNSTFVGWTSSYSYNMASTPLYITDYDYEIGRDVKAEEGIYLNGAVRNLYTAWIGNTNYYTYDLNENIDEINFEDENFKNELLNEDGSYKYFQHSGSYNSYSLQTVADGSFMVTIDKNSTTYSLMGWKLKDGTFITGQSAQLIEFNAYNNLYIKNSEIYDGQYKAIPTYIYLQGNKIIDNNNFYTEYNEAEDRSYIILKSKSIKKVVLYGSWVENSILTFSEGVSDATWTNGTADDLTTRVGGSVYVELPAVDGILSRPYYTFEGWSVVNREDPNNKQSYDDFIKNNVVYKANVKYDLYEHEIFQHNTTLYAVWRPVVYSLMVYQKSHTSSSNSTTARIYIAKEKFSFDKTFATNEITLAGNSIIYYDAFGNQNIVALTTSAIIGYGLSGWSDNHGKELVKDGTNYKISVADDVNGLFNEYPTSSSEYISNIYPVYSVLKFNVTINIGGEGINKEETLLKENVEYGTVLKKLLPIILDTYYERGYAYKGWNISGDVDNKGVLKPDYVLNLNSSNLTVRSDLELTLVAEKVTYTVRFLFKSPEGLTKETVIYNDLCYGDELSNVNERIAEKLIEHDEFGYNFSYWEISAGGVTTQQLDFSGIVVTSPLDITPKYTIAKTRVNYIYHSDNSLNADKMEKVVIDSEYKSTFTINLSTLSVIPVKSGYILKGWINDLSSDIYFEDYSSFILNNDNFELTESIEGGLKVYDLNLYPKWVVAKTISFDLSGVTITGETIPSVIEYEIGTRVYTKLLVISSLSVTQVSQTNGRGTYNGIWVDNNGVEYNVYSNNTFIVVNENLVLKPKFDPIVYTINFKYFINNQYYDLNSALIRVDEDYSIVPTLPTEEEINRQLSSMSALSEYQALNYYLGKNNFENKVDAYRFDLGAEFDFVNNEDYFNLKEIKTFNFYIEIEKVAYVFYYSDRNMSSSSTQVKVFNGKDYVIGASDSKENIVDIIPTKKGYYFVGWSTTLTTGVEYNNGQTITFENNFIRLFPVWQAKEITINYHYGAYDTSEIKTYDQSINLFTPVVSGYEVIGWATTGSATTPQYSTTQTVSVSLLYDIFNSETFDLYAVLKRIYYISYSNGLGEETSVLQTMVEGSDISLYTIDQTALTKKEGGLFIGWTLDNAIQFTTFNLISRVNNVITYQAGTYPMDNDHDYTLCFVAVWETAKYKITFDTYNSTGTKTINYGTISGNITGTSITENLYEYNKDTEYVFNFPSTASTYINNGTKYEFSGLWADELNNKYDTSVSIKLTKDYQFKPVYYEVFTLNFVDAGGNNVVSIDAIQNSAFYFNDSELQTAISTYNSTLTNAKVVGYLTNAKYYSTTRVNTELSVISNASTFETAIMVNGDYTIYVVLANYVDITIYKNYNYKTQEFSNSTTINDFIVNDVLNLNTYSYLGDTDYNTTGFVASIEPNYTYVPSPSAVYSGNTRINMSITGGASSIYLYPVLKAKVILNIDGVTESTNYVPLGTPFTINYDYSSEERYLTNWTSSKGQYVAGEIIDSPTIYYAFAKPYFQLQINQNVEYITNKLALIIKNLKPTDLATLPVASDVSLNTEATNKFSVKAWNISFNGSYIMNGLSRKEFALGGQVTIEDLLDELGYNADDVNIYSLDLSPVWNYNLKTLNIVNSEHISYNFEVKQNNNPVSEELKNRFVIENNNKYEFKLLNGTRITSTSDSVTFDAYLYENGEVVMTGLTPVIATIKVTRVVDSSYSSSGWNYSSTEVLPTIINISNTLNISAQVAEPDSVILTIKLKFDNGTSIVPITSSNYDTYKEFGHLVGGNGYEEIFENLFNEPINFSVVVGIGYEVTSPAGGQYNVNTNTYVFTQIMYDGVLDVVVKQASSVNPIIELDVTDISDFDITKLSGSVEIQNRVASGWDTFGNVNINQLASRYVFTNNIAVGESLRVLTDFDSLYYYVDAIEIEMGASSQTFNTFEMTVDSVNLTTTPIIKIKLKDRTYKISYHFSGGTLFSTAERKVSDSIFVELPELNKDGYILSGFKVKSNNTFVDYIITDTTFAIADIVRVVDGRGVTNQLSTIYLEPVWVNTYTSLTLEVDSSKGYFTLNGINVGSSYTINNILYEEMITINTTKTGDVVTTNSLVTKLTTNITVDTNGDVVKTQENATIVFVPFGTWNFVHGYKSGTSDFVSTNITTPITLTPQIEQGDGVISVSINDNITLSQFDNSNIDILSINFNNGVEDKDATFNYSTGSIPVVNCDFTTLDTCVITPSISSGFEISGYEIIMGTYRLSDYDNLNEFNTATGLNITYNNGIITITNLVHELSIEYIISRIEFNATIQVVNANTGTQLETIYNNLILNNISIIKVNNVESYNETELDSKQFRKIENYYIEVNQNYFEIENIYYVDNSVVYYVYNPSGAISDSLSSYNSTNNNLKVVYGGVEGNNIQFFVTLKTRTYDVIFHKIDNELFNINGYSNYEYGNNVVINSSFNTPSNIEYNDTTLAFNNWTYYDGNYELDTQNNAIDSTKFKQLLTLNWTFGGEKANLHVFANWSKLFTLEYNSNILDGFVDIIQSTLPNEQNNLVLNSELSLAVPTRNGFEFKGYTYNYGTNTCVIGYSENKFTAPKLNGLNIETVITFNDSAIKLGALITSDMANIDDDFDKLTLTPIWEQSNLDFTIICDANKGQITKYIYSSNVYTLGSFNVKYYNTLETGKVLIGATEYDAIIVKNINQIIGAYVIVPNTANYYVYNKTLLNDVNLTSTQVKLDKASELEVLFKETYVSHTINLNWDADYSQVSYSIVNESNAQLLIETYLSNALITEKVIDAYGEIELNVQYDKIVIKQLRNVEINCYIELNNYHYGSESNNIIDFELPANNNISSTEITCDVIADRLNLNFSQYFVGDLTNNSNIAGEYQIVYFNPVIINGLIERYEQTSVNSVNGEISLNNLVRNTPIYFVLNDTTYDIAEILCNNNNVFIKDTLNNEMYINLSNEHLTNNGEVKVVFENRYTEVSFTIEGQTYASAYFEGSDSKDKNSKLVAFANLITYGYDKLVNEPSLQLNLLDLFNDTSILQFNASSNVVSTIVKENGTEKVYYTEGDFVNLFNYGINENIAKNYYSNSDWTDIWFEGWNVESAYPEGEHVTVDTLYISRGIERISFVSINSMALMFNIDCMVNPEDNGATSKLAVNYALTGDVSRYSFAVLGTSIESSDYSGYYSNLYFKVKNNTILPNISYIVDKNSYVIINNDTSITFENTYVGKVLTFESGVENSIEVDMSKQYNVVINAYVKYVKVRLNFYDESNVLIKQSTLDSDYVVNYNTTFEEVIEYYNVNKIVIGEDTYTLNEVYTSNGTLSLLDSKLQSYLSTYTYSNGSIIELKLVYSIEA